MEQIVSWVGSIDADGVDIDFEDSNAFTGKAGYDGITFLSELTSGLSQALPSGSIITHAPQTPYWIKTLSTRRRTPRYIRKLVILLRGTITNSTTIRATTQTPVPR